jgi:hypothetical protein
MAEVFALEEFQQDYLFGVPILDKKGCPLPADTYARYYAAAVKQTEHDLDITFKPVRYEEEEHEFYDADYRQWNHLDLDHRAVQDVELIQGVWPASPGKIQYPTEWYTYKKFVDENSPFDSHIELRPTHGTFAHLLTRGSNLFPVFPSSGGHHRVPAAFLVTYTAGWPADKDLPADVEHLIGMRAAISLLNLAGDLTLGVGIASKSVSIPGLNKSVNTTQSATNAAFGARIGEYNREIKILLPALETQFGVKSTMVSVA